MSKSRLKLMLALPRLVGMTKTNRIKFLFLNLNLVALKVPTRSAPKKHQTTKN